MLLLLVGLAVMISSSESEKSFLASAAVMAADLTLVEAELRALLGEEPVEALAPPVAADTEFLEEARVPVDDAKL